MQTSLNPPLKGFAKSAYCLGLSLNKLIDIESMPDDFKIFATLEKIGHSTKKNINQKFGDNDLNIYIAFI